MTGDNINAEKLVADLKLVVRDAEELLRATADDVGDKAREARAKLTEQIENARRTCQRLEDRAMERVELTEQMVKDNPLQALGLAFGIGLVVGMWANRR